MRYAVPTSGGMIAQHFGHCEQFVLFDIDEAKKEIIAGGMGSRAQMLFTENRIEVAVNVVETDPEKAVMAYLDGLLEVGDDVCDH